MKFDFLKTMTAAEYHADPCDTPSLSASTAKTLITRSPQRAYLEHPKLGGGSRTATKAMDRGDIIHAMILNQPTNVEILPFIDYRTKPAQAERDAVIAYGKIPVLSKEWTEYRSMADAIRNQFTEFGIRLEGQSEGVALWTDRDDDGVPVQCRSRFDHVFADGWLWIYDLKTCADASPKALTRQILNFGYDIQAAAYTRAIDNIAREWQGRVKFMFLFAEDDAPFPVTPIVLDGAFAAVGDSKWRRAVSLWSKCLRENNWPAYATEPIVAMPPQWAIRDEMNESPTATELINFLEV